MQPNSSQLLAGIARREINPAPGTALFGYPGERFGVEVADSLNATALVLKTEATSACLVSVDVALVEESDVLAIAQSIEAATGIPAANVTICATHTHSAPITVTAWGWGDKNEAYLELLRGRVVEAATEANGALKAARVGFDVGETDTGINRREVRADGQVYLGFYDWGVRDRALTVARFETEDGPLASLVHLTAHPTSRGGEPSVSRDWPGVMMDRVEAVTKAPVLFINGSFGDVAPRTNVGGVVGDGAPAATEVGLRAATDALRVWADIRDFRPVELETLTQTLQLPLAPLASREEAEAALRELEKADHAWGMPAAEWNHYNAVLAAHDAQPQVSRAWQQTITRLGPLAVVPFAGEVFSEIALRVQHDSPFAYTLSAGTSNGSHGYYCTREAWARGGYEPYVAKAYGAYILAQNLDDVLVQENLRLLQTLANGDNSAEAPAT